MIIECINCNKKFDVNSELIPESGRSIQCGSCNHTWFFKPTIKKPQIFQKSTVEAIKSNNDKKIQQNLKKPEKKINKESNKNYELTPYKSKYKFSLSKFLSYIIVLIISFIALIVIIDTFKSPIYKTFPNLEIVIFSLFEVLKDIELFIKDLI